MKKVVNKTINHFVKNVDTYNNAGSTWLIFTETKQWVIELTKEKTLWYNYNFFKNVFNYLGLEVVENQHYITQWVEENIINKVKRIDNSNYSLSSSVKDVIENGVKPTTIGTFDMMKTADDTIQNGVKQTQFAILSPKVVVEDTIQNGVKHTEDSKCLNSQERVEDTIQNGVKETKLVANLFRLDVEDTIQNGVKETLHYDHHCLREVVGTIQNGVKKTKRSYQSSRRRRTKDTIENGVKEIELHKGVRPSAVEDTIENGIKETKSPGADGDLLSTLEWIKENNTVNIPELIDDVIENGVKYTGGIGNPNWMGNKVENAIENGVKTTYSDVIPQEYDWSDQFDVNDVIENGIKATVYNIGLDENQESEVSDVIQNGIKETHDDVYHHKGRVDGVIRNGVKVVIPAFKMFYNPMNFEPVISEEKRITDVTDVIRDGIKEVQPLPAQDGNRDWGVYYYRKGEPTKPHTKYVDEVIENGIKEN
jgi:predicted peroxiredoxin